MEVTLVRLKKNGEGRPFVIPKRDTLIGRSPACNLRIPLAHISKEHCRIYFEESVPKIRDLGSRNGTYLNDHRISEAIINAGDIIKLGPLRFMFQIDGKPFTQKPAKESSEQNKTKNINKETKQSDDSAEQKKPDSLQEETDTSAQKSVLSDDDFDSILEKLNSLDDE